MRDIRRLLVALDLHRGLRVLTAGSCAAAEQGLRLAERLGAEVVLLHSTASDEVWDAEQRAYVDVPETAREARRPVLDEVADRFRAAGLTTEVEITDETAWLGIIHSVLSDRIDLVIAGKRNERHLAGPQLGSVSMKLLRKCPCAVWVAQPGSDAAPRCVLAASDLSPVGEQVIEYAAFVAHHCGAALHVVHAFQLPFDVQLEGEQRLAEFERSEREQRTRRLEAQIARMEGAPQASYHVGRTSPTRAILECTERIAPDLVVMGTVSRGGVPGFLVGNTAERLIGRLDCSLLAVKPADFVCPVSPEP